MDKVTSSLTDHFDRHPTHVPLLISIFAIIAAMLVTALYVSAGWHHNGTALILVAGAMAVIIACPAGIVGVRREQYILKQKALLESAAFTDALTGVFNRRAFVSAVKKEQMKMKRDTTTGALILFDIDYFKQFNDRHGHATGDQVLISVAKLAHEELRHPFDYLARWGGEEFIIYLNSITIDEAIGVGERLRIALRGATIDNCETKSVTASFGVVALAGDDHLETKIKEADKALYEAKNSGRNRTVCYSHLSKAAA